MDEDWVVEASATLFVSGSRMGKGPPTEPSIRGPFVTLYRVDATRFWRTSIG